MVDMNSKSRTKKKLRFLLKGLGFKSFFFLDFWIFRRSMYQFGREGKERKRDRGF